LESDTAKTIKDADCGIVVEPENKALLIEAMRKMAAVNKSDLALMGKSGYNFALKSFSKQMNLDKLIALFESS
jgi:glycosyltransferase involved in cell wall biosynthesis